MVGILVSFWNGLFSGAMLVSGRVVLSAASQKNPRAYLVLCKTGSWDHGTHFLSGFFHTSSKCMVNGKGFPQKLCIVWVGNVTPVKAKRVTLRSGNS